MATLDELGLAPKGFQPVTNNPDDITGVLTGQNRNTNIALQNIQNIGAARDAALVEAQTLRKDSIDKLWELKQVEQNKIKETYQSAKDNTKDLRTLQDEVTVARTAASVEYSQHAMEEQPGFFRNPIANIGYRMKEQKLVSRLNRFTDARDDLIREENLTWDKAIKEMQQWRQTELAMDYLAHKYDTDTRANVINSNFERINSALTTSKEAQAISQQFKVDPNAASKKMDESVMGGHAEYFYWINNNGSMQGYNGERAIANTKLYISGLSPSQAIDFSRQVQQFQIANATGSPIGFDSWASHLNKVGGFALAESAAGISGNVALSRVGNAARMESTSRIFNQLQEEALANSKNLQLSPSETNALWKQAQESTRLESIEAILPSYIMDVTGNIDTFSKTLNSDAILGSGVLEVVELGQLNGMYSPAVTGYFAEQGNLDSARATALDYTKRVGDEKAALAIALYEGMKETNTITDSDAINAISNLFSQMTVANYMGSPNGLVVRDLMDIGGTFGIGTGYSDDNPLVIPVDVKVQTHRPQGYASDRGLLAPNESEPLSFWSSTGAAETNLTNPVDIQQLILRRNKYVEETSQEAPQRKSSTNFLRFN